MTARPIRESISKRYVPKLEWPDNCVYSAGERGVVFQEKGHYRTAFFEVTVQMNPGTFLRGEAPSMQEAEVICHNKFTRMMACKAAPEHGPFEAKSYTNGAGYCTICGTWFARVLEPQPKKEGETSFLEKVFTGDEVALDRVIDVLAEDIEEGFEGYLQDQ